MFVVLSVPLYSNRRVAGAAACCFSMLCLAWSLQYYAVSDVWRSWSERVDGETGGEKRGKMGWDDGS